MFPALSCKIKTAVVVALLHVLVFSGLFYSDALHNSEGVAEEIKSGLTTGKGALPSGDKIQFFTSFSVQKDRLSPSVSKNSGVISGVKSPEIRQKENNQRVIKRSERPEDSQVSNQAKASWEHSVPVLRERKQVAESGTQQVSLKKKSSVEIHKSQNSGNRKEQSLHLQGWEQDGSYDLNQSLLSGSDSGRNMIDQSSGSGKNSMDKGGKIIMDAGGGMIAFRPHLNYPAKARRFNWQGTVVMILLVDKSGKVTEAVLEKSSGYDLLDKSALEYGSKILFHPYEKNNNLESFRVRLPVRFQLK